MSCSKNSSSPGTMVQMIAGGSFEQYHINEAAQSHFRTTHRKTTRFAMNHEIVEPRCAQKIALKQSASQTVSYNLQRTGDVVRQMYVMATLPALSGDNARYVDNVAHALVDSAELCIGSTLVDSVDSDLMMALHELSGDAGNMHANDRMVGRLSQTDREDAAESAATYFCPLPFFFCGRNHGMALPLVALQYHDVTVSLTYASLDDLIESGSASSLPEVDLVANFGYLDQAQRVQMAGSNIEMLVPQHQKLSFADGPTQKLRFNHAVTALIMHQGGNQLNSLHLELNQSKRTSPDLPAEFYRLVTPYETCSRARSDMNYYVIPFGLDVLNESSPAGALNFSRIDEPMLTWDSDADAALDVYARSWNVLRVAAGSAGLVYSYSG